MKAVVLLIVIIPLLAMILFSKYQKYAFIRTFFSNKLSPEHKSILEIKQELQKLPSDKLMKLHSSKECTLKEKLIIESIIEERGL